MLREWKEPVRHGEEELKMRLAAAREKLAAQQLLIKEQKVPVLVLLEGWGTAGKGYCIGQIIENIDPRHFKVESMERKTGEEERKPFLYRHFTRIPEAGKFVFLDSGWMDEVVEERLHGELSEEKYAKRIESVLAYLIYKKVKGESAGCDCGSCGACPHCGACKPAAHKKEHDKNGTGADKKA